ncbi:MAG: FAD-dependent oxidoreductase [Actinomycetota bacterium]
MVDIAVVGAGVAGLTTALLCSGTGRSVLVLEADRIGSGTTSQSTVKVTAGHGTKYAELVKRHGADAARTYAESNSWGLGEIVRLVEELEIDCDLERVDHCLWADSDEEVTTLREEMQAELDAGLTPELREEFGLPFPVASGFALPNQALFHPKKYLLGLARAVEGAGGRIVEGTRVEQVQKKSDSHVLVTPSGNVEAEQVVLASHAPITDDGLMFTRYVPRMEYAIAARVRAAVPTAAFISAGHPLRSLRAVESGGERLLIVVGEGHKVGEEEDTLAPYRALATWTDDRFGLEDVVYRWCTHDLWPVDGIPLMGRMEGIERRYVLTGFGAWGMTNATAGAAIIQALISGKTHPWEPLFAPSRHHVRGGVATFATENIKAVAGHLIGDRLRSLPSDPRNLGPDEAGIFRVSGERVAAYRDTEGKLCAVSAVCTHVRCVVAWNPAERTWDCPCHGSRFAVQGDVISGPATKSLKAIRVE